MSSSITALGSDMETSSASSSDPGSKHVSKLSKPTPDQAESSSDSASTQTISPQPATKPTELYPLFIKYLPKVTTDADLKSMFSKWPSVCDLSLFQWAKTNKYRSAVVVFTNKLRGLRHGRHFNNLTLGHAAINHYFMRNRTQVYNVWDRNM